MVYIVCTKNKSRPRKPVTVCEHCKYNKKCKEYQKYLVKKDKEVKILTEKNQGIPMFPTQNSSQIVSIGYNANTRTLRIEFKNKSYYDYSDVPPELFQQLMASPSKGKFFHATIKGKFEYRKIEI